MLLGIAASLCSGFVALRKLKPLNVGAQTKFRERHSTGLSTLTLPGSCPDRTRCPEGGEQVALRHRRRDRPALLPMRATVSASATVSQEAHKHIASTFANLPSAAVLSTVRPIGLFPSISLLEPERAASASARTSFLSSDASWLWIFFTSSARMKSVVSLVSTCPRRHHRKTGRAGE